MARYGAHPAVVAQRARHSYAELDLKSERLAAALQRGGVARGSRVAVFVDEGWEAVVSVYAVLKAGGVLVPIDAEATAGVLSGALLNHQPVAVITQSRLASMVAAAIASVLSVRLIVLAGGDRARSGGTCISFEETVARIGRLPPLAAAGADTDPAVLFDGEAPVSHLDLAAAARGGAGGGAEIVLPPLSGRAGLSCLLAAIDAGRTVVADAQDVPVEEDRSRAATVLRREPAFNVSTLLDAAIAGTAPAFQR